MLSRTQRSGNVALWVIFIVVLVGIVIALSQFTKGNTNPDDTGEAIELSGPIDLENDWIKGNPNATVQLVEYSDLQCPACRSVAEPIRDLIEEFGDDMAFAYRHFPLRTIHPNAIDAAKAAEAAGRQGQFFEMHDLLFERQPDWSGELNPRRTFTSYAEELGLDVEQFEEDYGSRTIGNQVNLAYNVAQDLGLQSTPTFFLNNEQVDLSNGGDLRQMIIDAIAEAGGTPSPAEEPAMTEPAAESLEPADIDEAAMMTEEVES